MLDGSGAVTSPAGLIAAINAANSSGSPTTITLAPGTTFDFTTANNSTNGGNALPVITGNLTIVGNGDTIQRTGTAPGGFRFFDVEAGGSLTLQDLSLKNGAVTSVVSGTPTPAIVGGGAIYSSGALDLGGVTVQSNKAFGVPGIHGSPNQTPTAGGYARGGGIYANGGTLILSNDVITGNEAMGGDGGDTSLKRNSGVGGAAQGGGVFDLAGSLTLMGDTFASNSAAGGHGGYANAPNGWSGRAGASGTGGNGGNAEGGGLFIVMPSVDLTISADSFNNNKAKGGIGGNGGNPTPSFRGNLDNIGNGGGGGYGRGGGLYVLGSNGGLTLIGDSISDNAVAGGDGGFGGVTNDFLHCPGGNGGPATGGGVYGNGGSVGFLIHTVISSDTATGGHAWPSGGVGGLASYPLIYGNAFALTAGSPLPSGTVATPYATQTISALPFTSGLTATLSYNLTSSPLGLNFSASGNQLTISGTPTAAGTVQFTVTATDSDGSTLPQVYMLTINPLPSSPSFTSAAGATFAVGTPGAFTITASGSPAPALTESSSDTLPSGVTFNATTGILSGTPSVGGGGVYTLHFTASNSAGSVGQSFMLTVTQPQAPVLTSGNSATFTAGQGDALTVTATGSPKPTLTESGALPSGVTFKDNGDGTATLEGTAGAGTKGTYQFTITANNGVGSDAMQSFTLTVNPLPVIPPPPPPPLLPPPPPAPPSLNVPSLLATLDSLLGGIETVNADGTETIVDSIFGFPLLVATFDHSGNLVSVDFFGMDVTSLFA